MKNIFLDEQQQHVSHSFKTVYRQNTSSKKIAFAVCGLTMLLPMNDDDDDNNTKRAMMMMMFLK